MLAPVLSYAFIMMCFYPIGVPLYYALTLFRNKEELTRIRHLELSVANEANRSKLGNFLKGKALREYQPEIDEAEERKEMLQASYDELRGGLPGALKKLTNGYEMRTYWFEIFECVRKILLILLPIFFEEESPEQLTCGLIVCFITFGSYMMYAPFIDDGDDLLSQVCQLQIFFSLLSAIVLKTNPNSAAMGYILPIMILIPPLAAVVFECGLLEMISSSLQAADNGFPTPCGRIGVGMRARAVTFLERLLGVKHVTGEEVDEEEKKLEQLEQELMERENDAEHGMVQHIKNTFAAFDADKSGELDVKELRKALRFYGVDLAAPRVNEIIAKYDDQPDGKVQLVEFAALVADIEEGVLRTGVGADSAVDKDDAITVGSVPAHVKATFKAFDADKSGGLNYTELRKALKFYGIDVSQPRAAQIIKNYDDDPDGRMELEEFAELVKNVESGMLRLGPKPKYYREPNQRENAALVTLQSRVRGNLGRKDAEVVRDGGVTPTRASTAMTSEVSVGKAQGLGAVFGLFSPKSPMRKEEAKKAIELYMKEHGERGLMDLMSEIGFEAKHKGSPNMRRVPQTDRPQTFAARSPKGDGKGPDLEA